MEVIESLQEDLEALCGENVPSFQRSMNLLMAYTDKHFFARGFPGTTRFRSFLDFVGHRWRSSSFFW